MVTADSWRCHRCQSHSWSIRDWQIWCDTSHRINCCIQKPHKGCNYSCLTQQHFPVSFTSFRREALLTVHIASTGLNVFQMVMVDAPLKTLTDLEKKYKARLLWEKSILYLSEDDSWAEQSEQKPHELPAAFIYIRFPRTSPLRLCSLPSLRERLVCDSRLTGRNLKDNLNSNITVITWELGSNWFLSVCMWRVTKLEPGPTRSIQLMLSSVDSSPNMRLCTPTESPLVQGYNLLFHC